MRASPVWPPVRPFLPLPLHQHQAAAATALWSNYRAAFDNQYSVSEGDQDDTLMMIFSPDHQAYVASLQASLGSVGGAGGVAGPAPPSYQQLAAASRLATLLGSQQTSTTSTSPSSPSSQSQENQSRKRPGNQFSIDELLRQDDKKGKFETDSKGISVAEVDENDDTNNDSLTVKLESECPAE